MPGATSAHGRFHGESAAGIDGRFVGSRGRVSLPLRTSIWGSSLARTAVRSSLSGRLSRLTTIAAAC